MQITDEMVVIAIDSGCSSEEDGTATLHAFNCYCDKCKKRMRAALEAALGARRKPLAFNIVRDMKGPSEAIACIEDLARELRLYASGSALTAEQREYARAALERWGLK